MACRRAGLWRLLTEYSPKHFNGAQPTWRKIATVVGNNRTNTNPSSRKMSTEQETGGLADNVIEKLCHEPDESTKDFIMQQTMYRIKDPKRSLEFYTEVLGMRLLQKFDFPTMQFSLYFMGYENAEDIPKDRKERTKWMFTRKATIELTHNWGTENEEGEIYKTGNEKEHKGFGHIGLHVPDVYKACERFEKMGVQFVKKPDDGKMKGLAFIKDPDGYWIEILSSTRMASDIQ